MEIKRSYYDTKRRLSEVEVEMMELRRDMHYLEIKRDTLKSKTDRLESIINRRDKECKKWTTATEKK